MSVLDRLEDATFPAAWAFAAHAWSIPAGECALGYAWSWAENQVTAAVKLVPLGQSAGQRMLAKLTPEIARVADTALTLGDDDLSGFAPGYAIASSRHEMQYTRLFRS
jgi:urease accessory protein